MAEGLPIITTENYPLIELCEDHCVGISDNNFYLGIQKIISNLDFYRENVKRYMHNISAESNNENLASEIYKRLENCPNTYSFNPFKKKSTTKL